MREVIVTKVDGGYIVRYVASKAEDQGIAIFTTFEAAVKSATEFFGENKSDVVPF